MSGEDKATQRLIGAKRLKLGKNVWGQYIRVIGGKRSEVAVIINDDTTAEDLRACWSGIVAMREQLIRRQGSDLTGIVKALRTRTIQMLTTGMSYAEVAMESNHDILVNLCSVHLDLKNDDLDSAGSNLWSAKASLLAFRMKEDDIHEWLMEGLNAIAQGLAPWSLETGPVDKDRVRACKRQFGRELEASKVVIKRTSLPKTEMVPIDSVDPPHGGRALDMANALLEREPNRGGLRRFNKMLERQLKASRVEKSG